MAKVKIKINGREVEAEEGLNLIEAARQFGVEIPHFCYHPGLGVDGNCRMCLIELEGVPKPQIACNTFVREGLEFHTDTDRVKLMRQSVLEFLFLNHPLDCPICDQAGECLLQDYYMSNGLYESRLDTDKVHKSKVKDVGERVILDAERCVLCSRCVRFCSEVTGTRELYIVNRGNRAEITTYPGHPLDNDYSLNTVDICPVGALTSKEFRFKKRVWNLRTTDSICTGCSRGCNIYLEEDAGVVYRYRPRENMEVNRYWMCDYGRTTLHSFNDDRLDVALRGQEEPPMRDALDQIAGWIDEVRRDGSRCQIILSPASSTETLYAVKRFATDLLGTDRVGVIAARPRGVEDEILRRAEMYPNEIGLGLLGLDQDGIAGLGRGGQLLLIIEDDPIGLDPELQGGLSGFERVVYLGSNECATSRAAHLSLPVTPHSECDGTYVNFEGRVQRFRKAIPPRGDALWAPILLARIAERIDQSFGWSGPADLWKDLSANEDAFAGIKFADIGEQGMLLRREAAAAPSVSGGTS